MPALRAILLRRAARAGPEDRRGSHLRRPQLCGSVRVVAHTRHAVYPLRDVDSGRPAARPAGGGVAGPGSHATGRSASRPGEVTCGIRHAVDLLAECVNEWNPSKTAQAEEAASRVAERVIETVPRTASLTLADSRVLLHGESVHERFDY